MICKDVMRKLSDYLDGELDPTLAGDLARHLEHCEDCKVVVDTTRKTIDIYCNTEPAPLPEAVRERIRRAWKENLGGGKTPR